MRSVLSRVQAGVRGVLRFLGPNDLSHYDLIGCPMFLAAFGAGLIGLACVTVGVILYLIG